MKIALLSKADVVIDSYLEALSPYSVSVCRNREELIKEIPDADILVAQNTGFQYNTIDAEVLGLGKNLKLIQHFGVAWDITDADEARRLNIPVATISAQNSNAVAEQTFYLVIGIAKKTRIAQKAIEEGSLGKILTTELSGKTICIVGLGKIGKILIRMAKAFCMNVIGVKRTPDFESVQKEGLDSVYTSQDLHKALPVSDFVVLAIPLNQETFDYIAAEEFKVMKKGSYLINVSRGPNVNKQALIQALADNKIAGYAADVFWEEPADPKDPLLSDERTLFSPHLGAYTYETVNQCTRAGRENIDRLLKGEPLLNVANM